MHTSSPSERLILQGIDAPALQTLLGQGELPPIVDLIGSECLVLGNEGLGALARSPRLQSVRRLSVIGQHITAAGAQALANSHYATNLVFLSLASRGECVNRIGVRGLQSLLRSRILGRLTTLDLSGNRLRNYGARLLANCPRVAALEGLILRDNDIDPHGAAALTTSPHTRNLRLLDLSHNPTRTAQRA